jgi:hypothetical protein
VRFFFTSPLVGEVDGEGVKRPSRRVGGETEGNWYNALTLVFSLKLYF